MDVCFAAQAELFVTASHDTTLHVVETRTLKKLALLRGHADVVLSCAASADGRYVLSCSKDKTVKLWDLLLSVSRTSTATDLEEEAEESIPSLLRRRTSEEAASRSLRGSVAWTFTGHQEVVRAAALDPKRKLCCCVGIATV